MSQELPAFVAPEIGPRCEENLEVQQRLGLRQHWWRFRLGLVMGQSAGVQKLIEQYLDGAGSIEHLEQRSTFIAQQLYDVRDLEAMHQVAASFNRRTNPIRKQLGRTKGNRLLTTLPPRGEELAQLESENHGYIQHYDRNGVMKFSGLWQHLAFADAPDNGLLTAKQLAQIRTFYQAQLKRMRYSSVAHFCELMRHWQEMEKAEPDATLWQVLTTLPREWLSGIAEKYEGTGRKAGGNCFDQAEYLKQVLREAFGIEAYVMAHCGGNQLMQYPTAVEKEVAPGVIRNVRQSWDVFPITKIGISHGSVAFRFRMQESGKEVQRYAYMETGGETDQPLQIYRSAEEIRDGNFGFLGDIRQPHSAAINMHQGIKGNSAEQGNWLLLPAMTEVHMFRYADPNLSLPKELATFDLFRGEIRIISKDRAALREYMHIDPPRRRKQHEVYELCIDTKPMIERPGDKIEVYLDEELVRMQQGKFLELLLAALQVRFRMPDDFRKHMLFGLQRRDRIYRDLLYPPAGVEYEKFHGQS